MLCAVAVLYILLKLSRSLNYLRPGGNLANSFLWSFDLRIMPTGNLDSLVFQPESY